jgi:hypothetical protein
VQGGKAFWERLPNLSVILGEIISRVHGNFEQKNWVLESCLIIINYIMYHIYTFLVFENSYKDRDTAEWLKTL